MFLSILRASQSVLIKILICLFNVIGVKHLPVSGACQTSARRSLWSDTPGRLPTRWRSGSEQCKSCWLGKKYSYQWFWWLFSGRGEVPARDSERRAKPDQALPAATRRPEQLERNFKVRLLRVQRDESGGRGCFLKRGGTCQNTSAEKQGGFQPPLKPN